MAGQIGYLTVALLNLGYPILSQFKIRSSTYYTDYDTFMTTISGTNYMKIADMIMDYGALSIWGVAFITQILSMAGILADINMMVWDFGVMYGLFYITLSYVIMQLLGMY